MEPIEEKWETHFSLYCILYSLFELWSKGSWCLKKMILSKIRVIFTWWGVRLCPELAKEEALLIEATNPDVATEVSLRFLSSVLLRELWVEDCIDKVSDLTLPVPWRFGDTYGTALFLPNSFCSQSSRTADPFGLWPPRSELFLRGSVLLKVREFVTNGDWEPLANPLRLPGVPVATGPKFLRRSSPPPRFSNEPLKGVDVLLTTPRFSETLSEFPLLLWLSASNLKTGFSM